MNDVDVSILFVNYKTSYLIKDVISSIKERSSNFTYEIIIVDNSCDQEELSKLQEYKDDALIIDAKDNLGFGKANNLGATYAHGKYLHFLNTDTLLMNNAIYELKKFLDENNNVSIVGSNLYTREERPNHSYIPYEMNRKGIKKLNSLFTSIKKKITGKRIDFNYSNQPLKLDGYVCGASLMMRKEDFDKLGGFDNDIFMYSEETLLCYRTIHELHKDIYNVPSSKIIHFEGESFKKPISYQRYKTQADGDTIYYLKAFGKEETIKIIKNKLKTYKKKAFISKLTRNKSQVDKFNLMYKAYKEKLEELQ